MPCRWFSISGVGKQANHVLAALLAMQQGGGAETGRPSDQNDVALICSQCHGMVHATFTNATLAALYPTIHKLREAHRRIPCSSHIVPPHSSRALC